MTSPASLPTDDAAAAPAAETADAASSSVPERLKRIHEVAADTGLTARTIRYYEELGLLAPAGRSEGAYRLYDSEDLERLRFIRGLRDDAGFSLAEIGQMLEDEQARSRNRIQFRQTHDPARRRVILTDAIERVDRQVATLERKKGRLEAMIREAVERRRHLAGHLDDLDAGREPAPHRRADAPATGRP